MEPKPTSSENTPIKHSKEPSSSNLKDFLQNNKNKFKIISKNHAGSFFANESKTPKAQSTYSYPKIENEPITSSRSTEQPTLNFNSLDCSILNKNYFMKSNEKVKIEKETIQGQTEALHHKDKQIRANKNKGFDNQYNMNIHYNHQQSSFMSDKSLANLQNLTNSFDKCKQKLPNCSSSPRMPFTSDFTELDRQDPRVKNLFRRSSIELKKEGIGEFFIMKDSQNKNKPKSDIPRLSLNCNSDFMEILKKGQDCLTARASNDKTVFLSYFNDGNSNEISKLRMKAKTARNMNVGIYSNKV